MNRPGELSCFLNSLREAGDNYDELIVVDSSTTPEVLSRNQSNIVKANGRQVIFNVKGVSKARNKGIKESKGNIIVFADDDFVVTKGWINSIIPNFDDPHVSCVTGRMLSHRNDEASNLYEQAMSFDRGPNRRVFSRNDLSIVTLLPTITQIGQKRLYDNTPVPWAVGYGFYAFRRSSLEEEEFLFDENLGRGTRGIGGEDPDMFYRFLKAGHIIVYEPKAVILHDHRKELEQIFEDARNSGVSMKSLIAKYSAKDPYMGLIRIGYLFLAFFSIINATVKSDAHLKLMVKNELTSFLRDNSSPK